MRLMVIGAGRGLGRALVEGLCRDGDVVVGVSRRRPEAVAPQARAELQWIEADLADPRGAAERIAQQAPGELDVLVCNVGIWEGRAFETDYDFLACPDEELVELANVNVAATLLLLKRLVPRLLGSGRPQIVLTGSTSGLPQSGRPEVAFAASKFALRGMADALREGFRDRGLAVTCLQLGYLNTEDSLSVPVAEAAARGGGRQIPLHDVVAVVRCLLDLSGASFVREIVLPAIRDPRF